MEGSEETQAIFEQKKRNYARRLQRRWTVARWWKRLLYVLIVLLMLLFLVLLIFTLVAIIRAATISNPQFLHPELFSTPAEGIDDGQKMQRAERLVGAIAIRTVSEETTEVKEKNFTKLHDYIATNFPLVHSSDFIKREVINEHSLLYTVTGSDNGNKLPYMLTSHLDVVPANPDTWEVDPFDAGIIDNTFIYGRGAFDDKAGIMGMMEAFEYMLSKNERPKRSFYIAFGHDEEITGENGAGELAKALKSRGVNKLDFLLDEGFFVTRDIVPGATQDIALIGVTEKGSLTLELEVIQEASHSSFPPWESSIGILAEAVSKLEKNKLPARLGLGPERYTLEYVAPYVDFGTAMLFTNLWLFSGLMTVVMQTDPLLNTIIRTTTALTVIDGGNKHNVVPSKCTAIVNHRVHPSQTVDDIIKFDRDVIDDSRVKITVLESRAAHPIAPFGPGDVPYHMVEATILQTFPKTAVVPGLMVANTDTWWYLDFTENVYRFVPTILNDEDTQRFHGDNERISVDIYAQSVSFYHRLFKNADAMFEYAQEQN